LKPISSHFKGKKPIQAALKEVSHFADVADPHPFPCSGQTRRGQVWNEIFPD
jgi:hypothetical protein